MRKKSVAGNGKMNGTRAQVQALTAAIKAGVKNIKDVETIVLPTFVFLPEVSAILKDSTIAWGAQNFYLGSNGAFTGEVAGPMLVEFGCRYVLVGHSER